MTRKICFTTGSRADYGLIKKTMQIASKDPDILMQLIVTGMHLESKYGLTIQEIEKDEFTVDESFRILSDSENINEVAFAISRGIHEYSKAFTRLLPDIVVILGDRFEALAAAVAAMSLRIPIAHIHGGESTEGLIDEAIRHSITKMSHIHLVATKKYSERVIQLGEQPNSVHVVGGLGVDAIADFNFLSKSVLEEKLGLELTIPTYIVTFHPETLKKGVAEYQINELLEALDECSNRQFIFTLPNADQENDFIFKQIKLHVEKNSNAFAFNSLGQEVYFSLLKFAKGVIGNSSSGLLEVPSFQIGTINIGDRQKGRTRAKSVIDCAPTRVEILDAIKYLETDDFQRILTRVENPYHSNNSSEKVINILKTTKLEDILLKKFFEVTP